MRWNFPTKVGCWCSVWKPVRPRRKAWKFLHGATRTVIVGNYRLGIGGDLIVSVDGKEVESQDVLARVMTRKRIGDTLQLEIIRAGKRQKLTVKLGDSSAVL